MQSFKKTKETRDYLLANCDVSALCHLDLMLSVNVLKGIAA